MNKLFSVKEIEKLIKICKKHGVSSLKCGEIELNLDSPEQQSKPRPHARVSAKKSKEAEEKGNLQDQFNEAAEITGTLHLEDPKGFEDMLIRGELDKNH